MSASNRIATPVEGRERIGSLDFVRGVALFGILLMNITLFALPSSWANPTVWGWGQGEGANLWAWIIEVMFFEGTQRGLFSILFGAGFIVLTSRLEAAGRHDVADIYYRRCLWLVVFGVIHAYVLLWVADILFLYGMTALFLYPLRKLAPRVMLGMALAGIAMNAGWTLADRHGALETWRRAQAAQTALASGQLTEEQQADLDAWKAVEREAKPDEPTLRKDIEAHQGSYLDVLIFQAPIAAHWESWNHYRGFFDIFTMMLVGMALFKLGVLTLQRRSRDYWAMVLIGYPIGLAFNYHELRIVMDGNFSVLSFIQASWSQDFGRIPMALGHLGALLLFCRSGWASWLQRALAAVGRMALTNYISHSIICAFVFYGFGFGLYGELQRYQIYYVVGAIWLFQLIASPLWLKYFRFGPLEWLWRSLTYVQLQPMRGRRGAAAEVGR